MKNTNLRNTIKYLYCILLIFASLQIMAQTEDDSTKFLPNITPPSPSAYSLGNYGNVPIGLVNGTSNVNLPLLTYSTKNLSIPINLFYGSNGIKVDDISSSVGLGWNMNAGGIIVRSVTDVADEKDNTSPSDIPDDSILNDGILTSTDINYFYNIGNQVKADSETDIFSFNFNNMSGKFVLDKNQNPVLIENQNVKIEKITNSGIISFIITTNDGIKYYFNDIETTMFRAQNAGFSQPEIYPTSWYLTRVEHPLGDEIYLEYENNDYSFIASQSQALIVSDPYTQENCIEVGAAYQYGPVLTNITSHTMSINGRHIKRITSNNLINGMLIFSYSQDNNPEVSNGGNKKINNVKLISNTNDTIEDINFNYLETTNKRSFLSQIVFKDNSKQYNFEYITPELFPLRLSKSQDHWGYYNGKNNSTLVPDVSNIPDIQYTKANKEVDANFTKIGMLKKICYPTKGCSEFEYEANTYWGQKTITPTPIQGYLTVYIGPTTTSPDAIKVSEETIYLPFSQTVSVGGWGEFNLDACDANMNTDHSQATLTVKCIETNSFEPLFSKTQTGGFVSAGTSIILKDNISNHQFYFFGEINKNYKISLNASLRCTAGGCRFEYYNSQSQIIPDNIVTGGIRVKSAKDIDKNSQSNYKRFYYSSLSNLNVSSGISSGSPHYISHSIKRKHCEGIVEPPFVNFCFFVDLKNLVLTSSSLLSLYDKGSNVYYEDVTISYGDDYFLNGGESHQFIINPDLPGEPLFGEDFNHSSKTNSGWNNGLESKVFYFKKGNTSGSFLHLKESANVYFLDGRINKEIYSYPVRKNFQLDCFSFGQPDSIENLDIMRNVISSHWNYLSSNETKEYFYDSNNILNGAITTTTNYNYNNPAHLGLSTQFTTNSKNETLETRYFYPPDSEMASKPFVNELIAKNRIGSPLVTQTLINNVKLSEQETVYDNSASTSNLLLPKNIYAAKFPNNNPNITAPPVGQLEKKITYDKYDDKGNILQYTLENGTPVSIIWGYNKTQPIAKIENAVYASITPSLITAAQTASDTGTEASLLTALGNLRNDTSVANAMITTYTYKPLIGVSTITDSKVDIQYYTYDSFGRLQNVKDKDGNILSENEYHYKN